MIPLGILASQGAVWTPAALSQIWLWLTAGPTWCFSDAGGTTPCADGDSVYVWKDRSGKSHDLTQSTSGQRPKLRLVSGYWRVRFDGVDDSMVCASITAWPTTTGFLSTRFRVLATGQSLWVCQLRAAAESTNADYYQFIGDQSAYARNFRATRYNAAFSSPDTIRNVTYTQVSDADYRLYQDGAQVGSTQSLSWEEPTRFRLANGDGGFSNIDMAGIVVGASSLSSGNRALLETYLGTLLA